jgi:hypothetical protein
MRSRSGSHEKLVWGALLLVALILAAALLGAGLFVARYRAAADYPGAELMAGQDTYSLWPNPTVKRDTSYLTHDAFPRVYNFYSSGFALGPEDYAQSNCIQMAKNFTDLYIIERHMSVMLCDTPSGRMVFVMRALTLRLPR